MLVPYGAMIPDSYFPCSLPNSSLFNCNYMNSTIEVFKRDRKSELSFAEKKKKFKIMFSQLSYYIFAAE